MSLLKYLGCLTFESVKIHSPAARVFLPFPKISQHPACMDHAILHGKPFSNPLITKKYIFPRIFSKSPNSNYYAITLTSYHRVTKYIYSPGFLLIHGNYYNEVIMLSSYHEKIHLAQDLFYISQLLQ